MYRVVSYRVSILISFEPRTGYFVNNTCFKSIQAQLILKLKIKLKHVLPQDCLSMLILKLQMYLIGTLYCDRKVNLLLS